MGFVFSIVIKMNKILAIFLVVIMLCVSMTYSEKSNDTNFKARIYMETRKVVPLYTEEGVILDINDGEVVNYENFARIAKSDKIETTDITPKATTGDGVIRKWALCIGISDYEGTSNDLNYCDDDAVDWKNFLQGKGYSVTIILDSQATATNIDNAINQLLANEDADDYVVFTYSGHGARYRKYGSCMISHDMYLMTNSWFVSKFSSADSSHIYFAFDACQIGDFQKAVITNRLGAFASNKQYSYDGDSTMKNGVFTYYQMEGWNFYNNFEQDSAYAVQKMKEWAKKYAIKVDPFYVDNFTDYMYP
ncbi:MAG: caspase family protein [Thermoplasmatales archaeon]|nr:caspase family protein [Thermoplasmatales archaeon]